MYFLELLFPDNVIFAELAGRVPGRLGSLFQFCAVY